VTGAGRPLRVAVVGVGALGRHHARIYAALDGCQLVAVVDTNEARAREVAGAYGVDAHASVEEVIGRVDAVSVATPTRSHLEVARRLLDAGVPVLVEKPLARTIDDADALIAAASRAGVVLAVGHTERFNPAVQAARRFVTHPRFVEVHRLGTFPDRSLDIDVVFDLMIHDLDLLLAVVGEPVVSVDAVGVPVLTERVDVANARLKFASGCIANVTASRISRDRVRKIRFIEPLTYVSVDYASQDVECWRLVRGADGRPSINGGPVEVERDEPLRLELADFLTAVRTGGRPQVDGEAVRQALALADRINQDMSRGS